MRKLLIVLVGLTFAGGGVVRPAYSADNADPAKKIMAIGTVEPAEMVDVCPQVAGRIVKFGVDPRAGGQPLDYGSPVEVGSVLAQIDSELYAARLEGERAACARVEAELAQSRINSEHAEGELRRTEERKKDHPISDSDFDLVQRKHKSAKAAVRAAEAALAQSKAAVKQAEIVLGYTTMKSPIKGVIIDRRVSVGQMVAPAANTPSAFLVANIEKLEVWASVNEASIPQIRVRQVVRFTVDALPGRIYAGKVRQIRLNATMTQNVVTYTVVIAITSPAKELLPYLTAHVEFE
jgi:HlyD family secretion protein